MDIVDTDPRDDETRAMLRDAAARFVERIEAGLGVGPSSSEAPFGRGDTQPVPTTESSAPPPTGGRR